MTKDETVLLYAPINSAFPTSPPVYRKPQARGKAGSAPAHRDRLMMGRVAAGGPADLRVVWGERDGLEVKQVE